MKKYGFFLKVLRDYWKYVAGLMGFEILSGLILVTIPYLMKLQIDQLEIGGTPLFKVGSMSVLQLFAALLILPMIVDLIEKVVIKKFYITVDNLFATKIRLATQHEVWMQMSKLDYGFFENRRNRRIINMAANSDRIIRDMIRYGQSIIRSVIAVLTVIPIMTLIDWRLLPALLVALIVNLILAAAQQKQDFAFGTIRDQMQDKFWRTDSILNYDFHRIKLVGSSAMNMLTKEYEDMAVKSSEIDLKESMLSHRFGSIREILDSVIEFGVKLIIAIAVFSGTMTVGTFTMLVSYVMRLNYTFVGLIDDIKRWQRLDIEVDQFNFFMSLSPRIRSGQSDVAEIFANKDWNLEFRDVRFMYPDFSTEEKTYLEMIVTRFKSSMERIYSSWIKRNLDEMVELLKDANKVKDDRLVLDGVSMVIAPGKITALLGRNGAGKTTITQLMMHNYHPLDGKILLGDSSISQFSHTSLLDNISIIQQDPFMMWRFSIWENLVLGLNKKPTVKKVWRILEDLNIRDVIEKLPNKLDSVIGEDANLSGGERQMLVVARIILQNRKIIIFDEGVNQLDIERETLVLRHLRKLADKGAAVLFITHRITTARRADNIYFLDKGKIVEEGSHKELLAHKGEYDKFWRMQVVE